MNIIKKFDGNALTITLEGRLDTTTAPQLEAELNESLTDVTDLVFDFSKLEYISSAGLRILLASQKTMAKKGTMKICGVCDEIMEVFSITGFSDILTIEG